MREGCLSIEVGFAGFLHRGLHESGWSLLCLKNQWSVAQLAWFMRDLTGCNVGLLALCC